MSFFRKKSSTSIFKKQKHKKLGEKWDENKEPVKDGINFYLKYIGSVLLDEPSCRTATASAIRKVIAMAKAGGRKLNRVSVNVSPSGIKVIDNSSGDLYLDISIYRISYCSADANHDRVVAFISTDKNDTLECHAFLCPKRKVAQAVAITIAQSFNLAFETWQLTKERERESRIAAENKSSQNGLEDSNLSQNINNECSSLSQPLIDLDNDADSPEQVAKLIGIKNNEELDKSFTKLVDTVQNPLISPNIEKSEEKEAIEYLNSPQAVNDQSFFDDSTDFLLGS